MCKNYFWNLTQLTSFIVAVYASTRSMEFSKLTGQRISSGATQIGHMTRPDISTIVCANFCVDDCGMFHLNTVTNECGIFMERNYGEGVVLAPDPDWTVGYRIDHPTVQQGDWTLVFRAQSGVGEPTWESWNNTGVYNDNPVPQDFPHECLRLTNYSSCDRHFRSHILDSWDNVKEVHFSFIKDDSEVAYVLFNGTGTDRDTWFSQDRILNSTWSPALENETTLQSTGIFGWSDPPDSVRRFHLFGPHLGCDEDWVYTMVTDYDFDICSSIWTGHILSPGSAPNLFYSPSPTGRACFMKEGLYPLAERADVLTVWVKSA